MAVAEKVREPIAPVLTAAIRRFELPDLDLHGGWIKERLLKQFPHLNDRIVIGWLKGMLYSSETLFLYQPNSVCMAQIVKLHTLDPAPVVQERFVWCRDPNSAAHQAEAAEFYERIMAWAMHQSAGAVIVEEATDVPREMIQSKLGNKRIFNRQQAFVKL